MNTAWTIAGLDTSGNAGIHADCKTFASLGVSSASIITAISAQNLDAISAIEYVSAKHLDAQINTMHSQTIPAAIKIGMLGHLSANENIKKYLQQYKGWKILDPVLRSTSGRNLFAMDQKQYVSSLLSFLPHIDLVTPNIFEAEILLEGKINTYEEMQKAAKNILKFGVGSVLLKGGHTYDQQFSQDYWTNGEEAFWISSPRQPERHYRGTGCTLSTAIASALAQGYTLKDALVIAKMFINQSIRLSKPINDSSSVLFYGDWPECETDLPYLSSHPLKAIPTPFRASKNLGLYPVVNSSVWVRKLLSLGVKTLQLRIKETGDNLIEEIRTSIALAKQHDAMLFINDHWQVAIQLGAQGVHLGQEDLPSANIAQIQQAGLELGISTHCYYEVARAHSISPSYIACGPIYPTTSKIMPFHAQGIEKLKRWRRTLNYPLVAIGGINLERLPEIISTKVDGIALISAITEAPDPNENTQRFLDIINSGLTETNMLPSNEIQRYRQQIKLEEIGNEGQKKLKDARVLCIGAGGLGSSLLMYLAGAGVGTLGIVDGDKVEESNLHRQLLYTQQDIGIKKTFAAKIRLEAINPYVHIEAYALKATQANAENLISQYDLVADCSDNFHTRYLIHDACFRLKKPYAYASAIQFRGHCSLFTGSPCLRCMFPVPASPTGNCSDEGVFGVVPGMLGIIQATEIMKWILKKGRCLDNRFLMIDLLDMNFQEIQIKSNPDCTFCSV